MDTYACIALYPEEVYDLANGRVLGFFTLNHFQAGHWVNIDYYIMSCWLRVTIIVQCQSDGCSHSRKDGTVIWESFGGKLPHHSWRIWPWFHHCMFSSHIIKFSGDHKYNNVFRVTTNFVVQVECLWKQDWQFRCSNKTAGFWFLSKIVVFWKLPC